ncbi:uncharacterized protein LOC135118221 isoform X2 [Helicoverpa armigera]|uniref:uncharacterized protein LOC135118221 isoform X2 n=1 Tax=Helicoverpa armigera TaxID=29058 RepID=UPI00308323AB
MESQNIKIAGSSSRLTKLLTFVDSKILDEDMLLYWRKSDSSKCEPFTTYMIGCNKCVCSADGTPFCTRMACFKEPRFLMDESKRITPVDTPDQTIDSDDTSSSV